MPPVPPPAALARAVRRELSQLRKRDVPSVRQVRRRYAAKLSGCDGTTVLRFVRALLDQAGWMERLVAWEALAAHPGAMRLLDERTVVEMARGLSDWGSVDAFGVTLAGQAWRSGTITDETIDSWSRSPDRWQRRLALVATIPLNSRARGGSGDVNRTLDVCRALAGDRDEMVVKALSWALRELAKRSPHDVQELLLAEERRLPARVRREVRNKLQTGLKSPRAGAHVVARRAGALRCIAIRDPAADLPSRLLDRHAHTLEGSVPDTGRRRARR